MISRRKGYNWWMIHPGRHNCCSATVYRSIVGSWCFVAFIGYRGKHGIASVTGCKTMREAMSYVDKKHERKLQAQQRRIKRGENG